MSALVRDDFGAVADAHSEKMWLSVPAKEENPVSAGAGRRKSSRLIGGDYPEQLCALSPDHQAVAERCAKENLQVEPDSP